MKHFRLKIVLTVILAAAFVAAFSWIVTWQNYQKLSGEVSQEKQLTRDAVNYTLNNLAESWDDYEAKISNRYQVEPVFSALALRNIDDDGNALEDARLETGTVVSIRDGKLSGSGRAERRLGLDASLFRGKTGSFAAPNEPTTLVVYSRIGDSSDYYVEWYEDTVLYDVVEENINVPVILKRIEIAYDVPAIFVSCDRDSGEITGILYRNDRYFPDCENLEDLGLTREDLEQNDAQASGTLTVGDVSYTYVSGKSALPCGYVILLEPVPDLFAKAFGQAGYMIAALIVFLTTLLVSGFSLYSYVHNNILTPEEEKNYEPSHVRSIATLFGILGIVVIAVLGMFIYALNALYDDSVRGRVRLDMMDDSISMYAEKYSQNMQSFHDIYLEYGNHIAQFLDTYPQLRDPEVLTTLAESISASSITLYDSDGCETVSSGPWVGLELGTDPDTSTYDFRRILKGVSDIIHDPEADEVTGLYEMRLGIRIRDEENPDRYGVMLLSVDLPELTNHDIDPEKAVRQILENLSDSETDLWAADAKTGRILVSGNEELEGKKITDIGLDESDLKGSLIKSVKSEERDSFVTSVSMETPEILEWTGAHDGIIAYYRGPKTQFVSGMLLLALTGCILFCVIYAVLSLIILSGYTEDFFNSYKHVKGDGDSPGRKRGPLRRALAAISPVRRGLIAMEIVTAVFLLEMMPVVNSSSSLVRNTVYYYISAGDWERGFNLFSIAAILTLLSKVVLVVIGLRLLMSICASFCGSKGKTIFRLLSNVILYVALFFFLIKAFEYLGFSPTAIAAGMGSLALAISLGAQNFVADIFAGLTYVFEGTLHVGDHVEVVVMGSPAYQGRVVEVGVRCIKVLTSEGDVITCGNRDIRTITNSTQMNSRVTCEVDVSSNYPADEIEQMLRAELPGIGRTDRRILSGPVYNGITGIGMGIMTLSVSAECSEENISYVRDKLNVSLQRIFREHGYSI